MRILISVILLVVFMTYMLMQFKRSKKKNEIIKQKTLIIANAYVKRAMLYKEPLEYLADHYDQVDYGSIQESAILIAIKRISESLNTKK